MNWNNDFANWNSAHEMKTLELKKKKTFNPI